MCKYYTEHFFYECGHTGISKMGKEGCKCQEIQFGMRCHDGESCPQCSKSNLSKDQFLKDTTEEDPESIEQKIHVLLKVRRKWRLRECQFYSTKGCCCTAPHCINALTPESYKYWPDSKYTNMKFIPADRISDDRCAICWGFYTGHQDILCDSKGARLMLPCGHVFGRTCIEHTLYQRGKDSLGNKCPLCTVKFYPQHTLPSPYGSVEELFQGEKPTNKVSRWMWYLVYFLSMPWVGAVMFTMEVGPRPPVGTTALSWSWKVLGVFLIFLLSPIMYLWIVIVVLAGVLYNLLLDALELIFGPPQGQYIPLQTVTEYMLELEKNAQLLDNGVE